MTKLEEYKVMKNAKEKNYPILYIVKSTRYGVEVIKERQVIDIKYKVIRQLYFFSPSGTKEEGDINRYILDDKEYPYEFDIAENKTYNINEGYGSGTGDLWSWTYYGTFNKEDAINYVLMERQRINLNYHDGICLIDNI